VAEAPGAVVRNQERSRYELVIDGEVVGFADYRPAADGLVVFPHTVVDAARRGQGLGAVLVRGALDDVQAWGGTVEPLCWYVAQFIDEHPEYRPLLAGDPR
jgi:predicted GNAT family acetyltransferase